ncbi:hypothetical protein DITRI_Ditri16bG0098100 [Diplodiscus trichospermus]
MVIARSNGFTAAILTALLISSSSFLVNALDYPTVAYPPKSWINVPVFYIRFWDSASISPILINGNFVCGFCCQGSVQDSCLFGISIFRTGTFDGNFVPSLSPKIVWSANRNNPVKIAAALQLSEKGDLMLRDRDGTVVWNTNTAGKFVSGLNLTEEGNLVLYDSNSEKVWQSFDHPTDALVPGQALVKTYGTEQQKLVYMNGRFGPFLFPSASDSQFSTRE